MTNDLDKLSVDINPKEVKDNYGEIAIAEKNGATVERELPVVVTMRDRITGTYTVPRVSPTLLAARRDFSTAVNNARSGESLLADHPEHFTLYHIGFFDDRTGDFTPCEKEVIVTGDEVRIPEEARQEMLKQVSS